MIACPLCEPEPHRLFHEDELIRCIWDAFPVTPLHALVVTRRHVERWFDATPEEQHALLRGVEIARAAVCARTDADGFNIGINVGEAAGQTIPHLHVHLIPRRRGDVDDPRGGVRHVIPGRGNYLLAEAFAVEPDRGGMPHEAQSVTDGRADYALDLPRVYGADGRCLAERLIRDLHRASAVDIAVAFVTSRGLDRVYEHLRDVLARGGRLRFLTGDYLGVTEPRALRSLLDLKPREGDLFEARVFECSDEIGFHPKAYLVHGKERDGSAYVGSSNLTEQGLDRGIEWNYRMEPAQDRQGFRAVAAEFDRLFSHPRTRALTDEWVEAYVRRRPTTVPRVPVEVVAEPMETPEPHAVQREGLEALRATREAGNRAGLVVLATGLGKTWLAAFDSRPFERVLFVAHRAEILEQARRTFRAVRPDATLGYYTGRAKEPGADILFASIQSLGRSSHLDRFDARAFDYIVIDEFHHADAVTYRRLIEHFEPDFLLGLTATPERTDGGDLLALCGENLVYRRDLAAGIRDGLLCPFHYFGIPDQVEYANIPWRSGRFDERALEAAVATQARAANAFEQWEKRAGRRTLAFCVSQRHADLMAEHFAERGVACASVHTGRTGAPRAASLERLQAGELQVVFSVDIFNEGVDLPAVDTVLMLRPTESKVLWLQQFGRGLRLSEGKPSLTVVDYVGNHQTFLKVPMLLFPGVGETHHAVTMALERYERGEYELPPGCSVTYDLEAIELLKGLARTSRGVGALQSWYEAFREAHGARPTALETWHAGFDPKSVRRRHGSWFEFVLDVGDADSQEQTAVRAAGGFLREIETTKMTRSYKMLVLQAMVAEDAVPGSISLDALTEAVARQGDGRCRLLRADRRGAPLAGRVPRGCPRSLAQAGARAVRVAAGTVPRARAHRDGSRAAVCVRGEPQRRPAHPVPSRAEIAPRAASWLGDGGDR